MVFAHSPEVDFRLSSGKFHPDMVEAVWKLLDLRIAEEKVEPAMSVVASLLGKKIVGIPCRSTVHGWSQSRLSASHLQIAEV